VLSSEQKVDKEATVVPLSRVPLPSPAKDVASPFFHPWLYNAVLGNGHLLICLDETGAIAQAFYPRLDSGPHIRSLLLGVQCTDEKQILLSKANKENKELGTVSWLASEEWTHELQYMGITEATRCISRNISLGISIEQVTTIHPTSDTVMSKITITNEEDRAINCSLVTYAGFNFDNHKSGNTCFFDRETSSLTFFAFNRYVSIGYDLPVPCFSSGRVTSTISDKIFTDATYGTFNNSEYAFGEVSGAVSSIVGKLEPYTSLQCHRYICFAPSLEATRKISTSLATEKPYAIKSTHEEQLQLQQKDARTLTPIIEETYKRSLAVLQLLTDSMTGAILAAPECDPDYIASGGYGFCWPRDSAFIAYTLDTIGEHNHAHRYYEWALRVRFEAGGWYQRYHTHGELGPTWGLIQFDQNGITLWAICNHIHITKDLAYGQKIFPQLVSVAEYMEASLDTETGLAPITKDLWEERDGISTYACAATYAGFQALSRLAQETGNAESAMHWEEVATTLKVAIEKYLWDETQNCWLRGMNTVFKSDDTARSSHQGSFLVDGCHPVTKDGYSYMADRTIDVSILGLSVPFAVFPANDPRMVAAAETIRTHLQSPIGGIGRYQGDTYRGGNPWIICTLWAAIQESASGNSKGAKELYQWAFDHRTTLGLFSEQVNSITSKPDWVVPLAWSHAMFLLATHILSSQNTHL